MTADLVLVTGATGFLGRHTVPALLDAGFRVRLCWRRKAPDGGGHYLAAMVEHVNVGDLSRAELRSVVEGVRTVVHLAGLATGPLADDSVFEAPNVTATARLAAAARAAGVETFIHMSSIMAVTGSAAAETIDDRTAPQPSSAYGRSKLLAESALRQHFGSDRLAISLRPPLVVAGDARGNWARLQALAMSGLPLPFASVEARRSVVSADFLAGIVARLCRGGWSPELSGEYCVASPVPVSLADMVRHLRAGMGLTPRLFAMPPALLTGAATLAGLGRQVAGFVAPLVVDPARLLGAFGVDEGMPADEIIRQSGAAYRRMRRSGARAVTL